MMDLNNEPEEKSINVNILEEPLEKIHKKASLKQPENIHQTIVKKPSYDEQIDGFIEGILEQVPPTNEGNLNKDHEDPIPVKEKKKKPKLQNPEEKKLEIEKRDEETEMMMGNHKNQGKINEEKNVENESDNEVIKERKNNERKENDQGYGNEDMTDSKHGNDDLLVKIPTLKKGKSKDNFNENPIHPLSSEKQDIDNFVQDPPKELLQKKQTTKVPQPVEEGKFQATENKKPKNFISEKPPSREPIDPNPASENLFQGFKETFSAEDDRQLIEKDNFQGYENLKKFENLEDIGIPKKSSTKQTKEKMRKSSEKSQSSRSSSNSDKGKYSEKHEKSQPEKNNTKLIKDLLTKELMKNEPEVKNLDCPDTPNLGSPIKEIKSSINNQGSAYWSRNEHELENEKLRAKLQEYEETIKKQNDEIKDLKKQLVQHTEKTKRISSPKLPGYFNKKSDGNFFKKEPDLRKEDMDFWKIADEGLYQKDPQKLEDISALKDLWILNMESGSALYNNISIKKNQGVKPNPLTRAESSKSGNTKSRVLPKISMKKNLREYSRK